MSSTAAPQSRAGLRPRAQAWGPALVMLAVGVLVLGGLFRVEAAAAVRVWLSSTAFGHCFLVGPIVAWLAWERRGALAGLVPRPAPALAVLALPLAVGWLAAERLGIMEGRQLCAVFLVWLLIVVVLGLAIGRAMAVPIAYSLFLVPFGAFLVPALQDFTARFIDVGLGLLDIPHFVTATIIEIPEGKFRVAEACAGLRFLIAAIAFGALYACVIYRSAWRRAAFIAVCVVVPVLANGVRALGIVVLGHIRGSAEAGAVDHVVYGWLFFSIVILLLLLLGLPFRQDSDRDAGGTPAALGRAVSPAGAWMMRVSAPARPLWLAAAAVAVVVLAASGPAVAGWLAWRAAGDEAATAMGGRLAASLVVPPGCSAGAVAGNVRRVTCRGVELEVRVAVFPRLAGPAVLAAWGEAADPGGAEDAEASWLELPGADWRVVTTLDPERTVAAALWLDGEPAPGGLALRLRLALNGVAGSGTPMVLATIATAAVGPAVSAAVRDLAAAQAAGVPGHS